MRKTKDLPLVILQALEPFVKLKGKKFEIVDLQVFSARAKLYVFFIVHLF